MMEGGSGGQETYYPLAIYYLRKSGRYFGFETNYPLVLAIITDGTCSVQSIPWQAQPSIPFRTLGLVD